MKSLLCLNSISACEITGPKKKNQEQSKKKKKNPQKAEISVSFSRSKISLLRVWQSAGDEPNMCAEQREFSNS